MTLPSTDRFPDQPPVVIHLRHVRQSDGSWSLILVKTDRHSIAAVANAGHAITIEGTDAIISLKPVASTNWDTAAGD